MTEWDSLLEGILAEIKTNGEYTKETGLLNNWARMYDNPGFDWEKWASENSIETSLLEIWKKGKSVVHRNFYQVR